MNIYCVSLFLEEEETAERDLEIVNVVQAEDRMRAIELARQRVTEVQPHINVAKIWSWTVAEFRSIRVIRVHAWCL